MTREERVRSFEIPWMDICAPYMDLRVDQEEFDERLSKVIAEAEARGAAREREACATVLDDVVVRQKEAWDREIEKNDPNASFTSLEEVFAKLAAAIRARTDSPAT